MALDTVNSLVTLQQFYDHAGIGTTEQGEWSAVIENIINGVSWAFNTYTDRKLKARDLTEYYDGDNTNVILVEEMPINSSASEIEIYIDTDRSYGASTQVDSNKIIIYSISGKVVIEEKTFPDYPQGTKIVYNAGYSTIPYDLQLACLDQCKYQYQRLRSSEEGIASVNISDSNVTIRTEDLLKPVKRTLEKYRKYNAV